MPLLRLMYTNKETFTVLMSRLLVVVGMGTIGGITYELRTKCPYIAETVVYKYTFYTTSKHVLCVQ